MHGQTQIKSETISFESLAVNLVNVFNKPTGFQEVKISRFHDNGTVLYRIIKYKQIKLNTTRLTISLRCILTLFLSTTCFGCSYEPSSG
jgi:hypothetical protein